MHPLLAHMFYHIAKILAFFILFFIYIKFVGPIPFSVNSVTTQKTDTFQVTGEGKVVVKPDVVNISVGIQTTGPTVKGVQDQINNTIHKISSAIKDLGVDAKDIQTSNYSIYPNLDYRDNSQKITGYSASTTLSIKLHQIDKVNDVIDASTANGASSIGGVNFDVNDKVRAENEARQKAVDEAKKKAEAAAEIAGFKLGRIINYSEGFNGANPPILYDKSLSVAPAGGIPTKVEPGSSEISVTVTLSYELN